MEKLTSVTMVVEKTDLSKTQLSQMTSSVLLTTAHSGKRTLFGNPHFQYFALKVALSIQTARYCGFTLSSQPSIKHLTDKIVSTSQNGRKVSNEKLAILITPVSRRCTSEIEDENGGRWKENSIGQTDEKSKLKPPDIS